MKNILLDYNEVINYYSSHNVRSTLKKFGITYNELKEICEDSKFIKSPDQIKETYRTTRIEKYGSLEGYREAKEKAFTETVISKYGSKEFYNWIKMQNTKRKEEE